MTYVFFSIITGLFFALTLFFRKQSTKYVSLQTALFIESFIEFAILTLFFIFFSPELKKGFDLKSKGLLFAALAGITVSVAVASNYFAFKSGFLSKVVVIAAPSQIIFTILLGVIFLKDALSFQQIIGIILGIIGVILTVV